MVPPLMPYDTVEKAMNWMKEFHSPELPLVNGPLYKGLITEEDLLDVEDIQQKLGDLDLRLNRTYVSSSDHLYNIIKQITHQSVSIMPVLGENEAFEGVITLQSIILNFSQISAVTNPGGIITLEMPANDYSLTEVSRIVESNNAIILNSTVQNVMNSSLIEVTLKINIVDLSGIVASFERFGYTIKNMYQESTYGEILKDRYDSLMNYLNI